MPQHASRRAFSLVELALVIVVIGLIIGGVISGKAVLRAGQMRTVLSELSSFKTAINTFNETYNGLPGDITNASSYWSTASNGDGDGRISGTLPTAATAETYQVWFHLMSAGLVEGRFSGTSTATVTLPNMPISKIDKSNQNGFLFIYLGTPGSTSPAADCTTTTCFPGDYGNVFRFGNGNAPKLDTGGLYGRDAYEIDRKSDDGLPAQGTTRAYTNTAQPSCTTSSTVANAEYFLSNTRDKKCNLIFLTGFGNL